MRDYKKYLQGKGFSESSIVTYNRAVNRFVAWMEKQELEISQINYNDITAYIKYCKKKGNVQRTIQQEIGTLKHYFNYQRQIGEIPENPIQQLKIQGIKRQQLYDILKSEELEYLYLQYPSGLPRKLKGRKPTKEIQKRNRIIVGLLIYQGLNTTDLSNIELEHIKLETGTIEIQPTKKSNGRKLKLEPCQILELQHFILLEREQLLIIAEKETDKLIFSNGGGDNINNLLHKLLLEMKQILEKVNNFHQIRTSVITHWLKQYNLRETQYRAGHRYVSSTENYKVNDIESLQHDITKFSPSL